MRGRSARLRRSLVAAVFGVVTMLFAGSALAQLRVDITRGVVEPIPIAILPFTGDASDASRIGRDISDVVRADLERSGLFRPVDTRAFESGQPPIDALPQFVQWRQLNAQALVVGRTGNLPDGKLRVEFRLWDVFAEQQMEGVGYTTPTSNWRRIAHIIADAIYKRITGEDGYFDTRIVYIAESGPAGKRTKRLAIMDQDGANHEFLTDGNSIVLTPRFSPSSRQITFLRFVNGVPRVFVLDLASRREEMVGNFDGMSFASRFAPDGQRLALSVAKDGNSDIYTVDLRNGSAKRLSNHSGIDTSPSYSPDGRQIVFNSDRSGSQQLYVMDADGGNVRRISYGDGFYATPVWSPRGDLIAFTKIHGGKFSIGVMRPDGSGERILSSDFHVEGPAWSPNGRVLLYYRKDPTESGGGGGGSRLYMMDLTGRNEREVPTPQGASDPAWSPLQP